MATTGPETLMPASSIAFLITLPVKSVGSNTGILRVTFALGFIVPLKTMVSSFCQIVFSAPFFLLVTVVL